MFSLLKSEASLLCLIIVSSLAFQSDERKWVELRTRMLSKVTLCTILHGMNFLDERGGATMAMGHGLERGVLECMQKNFMATPKENPQGNV